MSAPDLPRRVEVCVIGAGFAGLRIATELQREGADYIVFDKGRSPGGRAATRRISEARVDHGIPWLTRTGGPGGGGLSDELIDRLREDGLIERTFVGGSVGDAWSCPEGINRIAKHLAEGLNVRYSERVEWIEPPGPRGGGFVLRVAGPAGTRTVRARHVVITAPVPQAIEIAPFITGQIGDADPAAIYEMAVLGLARLRHSGDIPEQILFESPAEGIESVILESAKFPDRPPSVTIRCDPAASERLFDEDDEATWEWIASRVAGLPFLAAEPEEHQVKRWRYSRPARPVAAPFVTLAFPANDGDTATISACGDGFDPASVTGVETETGLEAALASAQALLDRRPW